MKRPIQFLLSETYQSMTPEDAEFGEPSSQGFNFEDEVLSLEDLSSYLDKENFMHPSEFPITNGRVWISTEAEVTDYGTGESNMKSLHCKKVMDGDGIEIAGPQADRIWMKMVAKASGQKLDKNIHSMSP
jgi:hypothetical protein